MGHIKDPAGFLAKMDLSVIIPAKNESGLIQQTLTALKVALENWGGQAEIILVDNGSTDDTRQIAADMGCIVLTDLKANISGLRNLGARNSSGRIIVFLDADCVVSPDWALLCLENFVDKKIAGVGTRAVPDKAKATWVEKSVYRLMAGSSRPDFVKWLGTSNLFVRRELFFSVDGFDETLETGEDVNFCKKLNEDHLLRLEKRTDTIHLRESKTLAELFKREFWRGKSSIMTLIKSGFDLTELPSVIVPAINFFLLIFLPISFFLKGGVRLFFFDLIILLSLPVLMMAKNRLKFSLSFALFQCYVIGFVYLLSRSFAIVYEATMMVINSMRGSRFFFKL